MIARDNSTMLKKLLSIHIGKAKSPQSKTSSLNNPFDEHYESKNNFKKKNMPNER